MIGFGFWKAADPRHADAQNVMEELRRFFKGKGLPNYLVAPHKYLALATARGVEMAKLAQNDIIPNGSPAMTPSYPCSPSCALCGVVGSS